MHDPYLYEDVDVLRNKLNIKNQKELDEIERDVTVMKLIDVKNVKGNFDFEHLRKIHEHVFGDIYDWAGKEREIDMRKSEEILGGPSVTYAYPTEIKKLANVAFKKLNNTKWTEIPIDERAEQYAKNIAEIWQIHPFREGNTRTTIAFACEFANAHGFPMDKQLFAENPGFTRNALVMASIGQYSEYQHLTRIFKDSMERAEYIELTASNSQLNINLTTKGETTMSNKNEMDSISPSTMQEVKSRDLSPYNTANVTDTNAIAFLENKRQAVEANTYANNLRQSATTRSGGWNDRQIYEQKKAESNEYSQKAAEALEKIDVSTLPQDDFMQILDAQTDSKRGASLDDDIKAKVILKTFAVKANDKQIFAMMDSCGKKARDEMLKNAIDMYPECIPSDEELKKQITEIKTQLANGDPRPDIKNPDAINKYINEAASQVNDKHLQNAAEKLAADKNMPAKSYHTTGLTSFDGPSSDPNSFSL